MLYIHILHSLPQKRTILTVGCPTQESVIFAWLKSHHWLMPEFSQLNVCFSLGVSKGNIDDGLLACTPRILDALGAFAGCRFLQRRTLSHLSILGPRTPMCVWLRRGPLCQALSWEMKRDKGSSPSLRLTPVPYPQANKKQWYFVITFRLFLSVCSFVYSFMSILEDWLVGHMRKVQRLRKRSPSLVWVLSLLHLRSSRADVETASRRLQPQPRTGPFLWGFPGEEKPAAKGLSVLTHTIFHLGMALNPSACFGLELCLHGSRFPGLTYVRKTATGKLLSSSGSSPPCSVMT